MTTCMWCTVHLLKKLHEGAEGSTVYRIRFDAHLKSLTGGQTPNELESMQRVAGSRMHMWCYIGAIPGPVLLSVYKMHVLWANRNIDRGSDESIVSTVTLKPSAEISNGLSLPSILHVAIQNSWCPSKVFQCTLPRSTLLSQPLITKASAS